MSDATHNPNFAGFRATATDAITSMSHAHGQVLAQRDALLAQVAELTGELNARKVDACEVSKRCGELRAAAEALLPLLDDPRTYTWQEREPLVAKLRAALA